MHLQKNLTLKDISNSKRIRDSWVKFLSQYPWEWFVTLTFPQFISLRRANRFWNRWLRKMEKKLNSAPGYFRVTEYQQRGVVHFHALMFGVKSLRRLTCMDRWTAISGGYARIRPYEKNRGAEFYLTKYLHKGLQDYRLGGFKNK